MKKNWLLFLLLFLSNILLAQNIKITQFLASDDFKDSLYYFDNQLITLDYRKTHILISYQDFADSVQANYEIQMIDFDKKWFKVGHQNSVNYANLFGGDYEFRVRNVKFSHKIASVKFHLEEAFWQRVWFIPSIIAYVLLVAGIIFYFFQTARFRQQIRLQKVRNDIAADLHDDVGATLSSISFLTEIAKTRLKDKPQEVPMILDKILEDSKGMVQTMRGMIWSMNPSNDKAEDFFRKIENLVVDSLQNYHIESNLDFDVKNTLKLSVEQQRNIFLIFKEALNNIIKYAEASNVWVVIRVENDWLMIQLKDNGKGFDQTEEMEGNGLRNMKNRIEQMGGNFEISGKSGTRIRFSMPLT
jgi:signal transduction histidine kinase